MTFLKEIIRKKKLVVLRPSYPAYLNFVRHLYFKNKDDLISYLNKINATNFKDGPYYFSSRNERLPLKKDYNHLSSEQSTKRLMSSWLMDPDRSMLLIVATPKYFNKLLILFNSSFIEVVLRFNYLLEIYVLSSEEDIIEGLKKGLFHSSCLEDNLSNAYK